MRNRTCFHHAPYSILLKYYLFLGEKYSEKQIIFSCPRDHNCPRPFLATPHHQTVHAAEQTVTKKTATETCTLDGKICYGYENINEDHTDSMVQSESQEQGFFSWLWTQITTWFSSLMS